MTAFEQKELFKKVFTATDVSFEDVSCEDTYCLKLLCPLDKVIDNFELAYNSPTQLCITQASEEEVVCVDDEMCLYLDFSDDGISWLGVFNDEPDEDD